MFGAIYVYIPAILLGEPTPTILLRIIVEVSKNKQ